MEHHGVRDDRRWGLLCRATNDSLASLFACPVTPRVRVPGGTDPAHSWAWVLGSHHFQLLQRKALRKASKP